MLRTLAITTVILTLITSFVLIRGAALSMGQMVGERTEAQTSLTALPLR